MFARELKNINPMKRIEIATLIFASALIFNVGCAKNDDPQAKEYDNLIVYGNIYTARVDESKGKNDPERYVTAPICDLPFASSTAR